jgi:CRP/FNR family transcriptional regulator
MNKTTSTNDCTKCQNNCLTHFFQKEEIVEFNNGGTKRIRFKRGETIVKQGSFASHIIYLINGLVKLVLESSNNKENIIQLNASDSFICLSTLYVDDYFPYTVVALKDCDVCIIKKEIFKHQLTRNLKATEFVFKWYNHENQYLFNRLSVLSTRNNHGKLAETLLYLNKTKFKKEDVTKHLARNDIAELASISLESTNKILNELKNDLIIKIKDDMLEINNKELLERLSRIG